MAQQVVAEFTVSNMASESTDELQLHADARSLVRNIEGMLSGELYGQMYDPSYVDTITVSFLTLAGVLPLDGDSTRLTVTFVTNTDDEGLVRRVMDVAAENFDGIHVGVNQITEIKTLAIRPFDMVDVLLGAVANALSAIETTDESTGDHQGDILTVGTVNEVPQG